jgi:hypothetical protein
MPLKKIVNQHEEIASRELQGVAEEYGYEISPKMLLPDVLPTEGSAATSGYSLGQLRQSKGNLGLFQAIKLSRDLPSFETLFKGRVGLLGIAIVAIATFAVVSLEGPQFDEGYSIAIGPIWGRTSFFLARENKSLMMGEQAYPSVRKSILS